MADSSSFLQGRGWGFHLNPMHVVVYLLYGVKAGILTVAFSVRVVSRGGSSLMVLARVCASWIRRNTSMTGNQIDSYFSFSRPTGCLADSPNLRAAALQRHGSDVHIFLSFLTAPPSFGFTSGTRMWKGAKTSEIRVWCFAVDTFFPLLKHTIWKSSQCRINSG